MVIRIGNIVYGIWGLGGLLLGGEYGQTLWIRWKDRIPLETSDGLTQIKNGRG